MASCLDVERRQGVASRDERRLLARIAVAADTGAIVRPTGDLHGGVELSIPPGALTEDTEIELWVRYGDPRWPSIVQSFEIEPSGTRLLEPAELSLEYAAVYRTATASFAPEAAVEAYSVSDAAIPTFALQPVTGRDVERDRLTCRVDGLGTFVAMHPTVHALIHQPARIIDPRQGERAELRNGQLVASANGRESVHIGKGSLDDFWSGDADGNLLVVHGLMGTPLQLGLQTSLVPLDPTKAFNPDFRNIVVFGYPSGRGIAENANQLYQQIRDFHQPGFGCQILAHSTGGLVVRYAIERSHLDPAREGYRDDDVPLDRLVQRLVCVGTPNHGSTRVQEMFSSLFENVDERDFAFVAGVVDAMPGLESFTARLNAGFERSATDYYAIAGDVGGEFGDGFVAVTSAVGIREIWNAPISHQVFSGPLYDHLSLTALAGRTGIVAQSRVWLGKSSGDTLPIVGSVVTPRRDVSGDVELRFSVTDADSDVVWIAVQFSRPGQPWQFATPRDHPFRLLETVSKPAPGAKTTFVWDTVADRVGVGARESVRVRIVPLAGLRLGTFGQTGSFVIDNIGR